MKQRSPWGENTSYFYELSPDLILDSIERFGIRATGRVISLNSMENRVYEIELEDDSRVVGKFYRPGRWSREQILEEHSFLLDLAAQEIPVVAPVRDGNGETLLETDNTGIYFALFPKQRGRNPDELNEEMLLRLGRLLARVHRIGAMRKAKSRVRLDERSYGLSNLNTLIDEIPTSFSERYEVVAKRICELSSPLLKTLHYQRVHGDCHFGNILWGDEGPFLVDFDDMVTGPCVQDLWLLARSEKEMELLLSGYEELREFDHRELKAVEYLRALRYIHFNAWITLRFDDPAFQRAFPYFGTDKYWREQLTDLEEQLEKLSGR